MFFNLAGKVAEEMEGAETVFSLLTFRNSTLAPCNGSHPNQWNEYMRAISAWKLACGHWVPYPPGRAGIPLWEMGKIHEWERRWGEWGRGGERVLSRAPSPMATLTRGRRSYAATVHLACFA